MCSCLSIDTSVMGIEEPIPMHVYSEVHPTIVSGTYSLESMDWIRLSDYCFLGILGA